MDDKYKKKQLQRVKELLESIDKMEFKQRGRLDKDTKEAITIKKNLVCSIMHGLIDYIKV